MCFSTATDKLHGWVYTPVHRNVEIEIDKTAYQSDKQILTMTYILWEVRQGHMCCVKVNLGNKLEYPSIFC